MSSSKLLMMSVDEILQILPPGRRVRFLDTENVRAKVPQPRAQEGVIRDVVPSQSGSGYLILVEFFGHDDVRIVQSFELNDIEIVPEAP